MKTFMMGMMSLYSVMVVVTSMMINMVMIGMMVNMVDSMMNMMMVVGSSMRKMNIGYLMMIFFVSNKFNGSSFIFASNFTMA